jgi:hypothetical protein
MNLFLTLTSFVSPSPIFMGNILGLNVEPSSSEQSQHVVKN